MPRKAPKARNAPARKNTAPKPRGAALKRRSAAFVLFWPIEHNRSNRPKLALRELFASQGRRQAARDRQPPALAAIKIAACGRFTGRALTYRQPGRNKNSMYLAPITLRISTQICVRVRLQAILRPPAGFSLDSRGVDQAAQLIQRPAKRDSREKALEDFSNRHGQKRRGGGGKINAKSWQIGAQNRGNESAGVFAR
ncbi:MAG: hypothetical protein BWZ10_03018 [candidate division BRC1 bacterium ADurb.BinA364]|nr:MAG: hypothetical protein BWZ10_03018 [candidate division BRC1 bacterium ADurb.BinA364]